MKYLIVVRHGDYGNDGHIDDCGRAQISALAEKLKPLTANASVEMLASRIVRAKESADILGDTLGISYSVKSILGSDFTVSDLDSALALVESYSAANVLILVTHMPIVSFFPAYYCMNKLGLEVSLEDVRIVDKGHAVVIDCEAKIITLVKP